MRVHPTISATGASPCFQVDDVNTSGYELMLDWLEPFNSIAYSVGIIGIRCADIEPRNKGKSYNCMPVVIIPGPKQPKNLRPYVVQLLTELKELSFQGMPVTPAHDPATPIHHFAFLSGVLADTPARIKLARWLGVAGFLSCGWCLNQAVNKERKERAGQDREEEAFEEDGSVRSTMNHMGYDKATLQDMAPR